jgi:predicted amidophosphoribosyltransferase
VSNYHFDLPYGSLLNYIPKKEYDDAVLSRNVIDRVKSGNEEIIGDVIDLIASQEAATPLKDFLTPDSLLIPVPRSSLVKADTVWPSKVIAEEMMKRGYGTVLKPTIERTKPIRKSSNQSAEDRPTVQEHLETLEIAIPPELTDPKTIILIDDVVTQGNVSIACAELLKNIYPDSDIRLFAVARTRGFKNDGLNFFEPYIGKIRYYFKSGKTYRDPDN